MKKCLILALMLLLCNGCANPAAEETVVLEPYSETTEAVMQEPSPTQEPVSKNLRTVTLEKDDMYVEVYALQNATEGTEETVSSVNGVSLRSTLIKGNAKDEAKRTADNEKKSVQSPSMTEKPNGYSISYDMKQNGQTYACRSCISAEDVGNGYCVVTCIRLNTQEIDDSSMIVLEDMAQIWDLS